MPNILPLSLVVNVSVQVTSAGAQSPTFNVGLIIGTAAVIPSAARVRTYATTALSQMLTDGFTTASAEYIAAMLYASQTPQAPYVMIGRQDLTAVQGITLGAGGTGNAVGDILTLATSGATVQVSTVTAGAVTGFTVLSRGTGASVATAVTTTSSGAGTGATFNVTSLGETPLQAVQACRAASSAWYLCGSTTAAKADHIAIAEWAQSATPQMQYFFSTADADALAGTPTSVGGILTAGSYGRWQGDVYTTQGGLYPNNAYTWAAAMGRAMGLNTGLAGSYFKLPNKNLVGITPNPWSVSQLAAINSQSMNAYVEYNNTAALTSYTPAMTGSGQYFDQVLGLDMYASDLQYGLANAISTQDVPISNAGITTLLNFANAAGQLAATRGFLSGGNWPTTAPTVLNLVPGGAVPNGYLNQAPPVTQAMKTSRQVPLYSSIIQTDAVQAITIGVFVTP